MLPRCKTWARRWLQLDYTQIGGRRGKKRAPTGGAGQLAAQRKEGRGGNCCDQDGLA
jgi:hypothetical protein